MVAKVYFLYRPQSNRYPVRIYRPDFPAIRFFPDDADAMATGLSWPGIASDWQISPAHFWAEHDARRENDARLLQLVGRDARHDHGLSRHCATGVCRVWQFRRAAANRRAGHGLPESKHGELLGRFCRGHYHAGQFLRSRRRGQEWLDFLRAASRDCRWRPGTPSGFEWTDPLANRFYFSYHVVIARRD